MPQETTTDNPTAVEQRIWVKRVLGVDLAGTSRAQSTTPGAWQAACANFQSAIDTVSAQIETLRQEISAYANDVEDEDLAELARRSDFGINGFTENTFVKLRAAVMGASGDDLPRLRAAAPKVVEAAKAVRSVLETSEQVQVCDDNPFGVTVRIVGTLVPAVSELIRLGTGLLAA